MSRCACFEGRPCDTGHHYSSCPCPRCRQAERDARAEQAREIMHNAACKVAEAASLIVGDETGEVHDNQDGTVLVPTSLVTSLRMSVRAWDRANRAFEQILDANWQAEKGSQS